MDLYFKNTNIEKLCTDTKYAVKKLGPDVGMRLGYLILNIEKATNLYDIYCVPQYRMHKLKGDRINQYSLTISKSSKYRVIIYPLDENQKIMKSDINEKNMLLKALAVEIVEVNEHYD